MTAKLTSSLLILFLAFKTAALLAQSVASAEYAAVSTEEKKLYDGIMAHRAKNGLPPIPLSKSLCYVARVHVLDLETNQPNKGICNLHSWSDKGSWIPCCYTSDHAKASLMWAKPRELTTYPGEGYEIAHSSSGGATAGGAFNSWLRSPAHASVMMNREIWRAKWNAIGVGIYGKYAVAWFGREIDPAGQPALAK
jgi:hypothetical protein